MSDRRKRFPNLPAIAMVIVFGSIAFFGVVGNERFKTYHTIDVVRLMTAGAAIAVAIFMTAGYLTRDKE